MGPAPEVTHSFNAHYGTASSMRLVDVATVNATLGDGRGIARKCGQSASSHISRTATVHQHEAVKGAVVSPFASPFLSFGAYRRTRASVEACATDAAW